MLRPEFEGVNHKRVLRLYQQANLSVRKRRKAKRPVSERVPLQLARAVNEVWSMDFVSDSLVNGRRIKIATWRQDFNEVRPHSSLGRIPPARFTEQHRQRAGDAARGQLPNSQID